MTKKISKCAVKLDENWSEMNDLLSDAVFEASTILDALTLTENEEEEEEDEFSRKEDMQTLFPSVVKQKKKTDENRVLSIIPDPPTNALSDNDDNDDDDDDRPGSYINREFTEEVKKEQRTKLPSVHVMN